VTTTAEKRAWLRENGHPDIAVKGVIPPQLLDEWDQAHPGDTPGDDDFDTSAADNPPADDGQAETPPRKPRGQGSTPRGKGRWPFSRGGTKPKQKRVPVDEVIAGGWRLLAKVAKPIPPLQRTLKIQAPVAGLLLEDTIRGTIVDTVLQPIARLQRQGKAVAALAGPPMLVTAGTLHMQRAAAADEEPNPVIMGIIHEGLRESLMLWMDVAGPKFEQAMKREKQFEDLYGQRVDDLIELLFSPPPAPGDTAAVQAEEDAIARAQGILRE